MATKETTVEIQIDAIKTQTVSFCIVGDSPLIMNRLAQKAQQQLLLPPLKKNQTERATTLKHDPYQEFLSSPYLLEKGPTKLAMPATSFKKSMLTAALDLPGTKKSQMGRLMYVVDEFVPIFGVPEIFCSVVRNSDINRTPDVRSRLIVPKWASVLELTFTTPLLSQKGVTNLLLAAGQIAGVGDFRQEKGAGRFGSFRIVSQDDTEFKQIMKEGGRDAQFKAMQAPAPYNTETSELLAWFTSEAKSRNLKAA
jgi:hypothetical protein